MQQHVHMMENFEVFADGHVNVHPLGVEIPPNVFSAVWKNAGLGDTQYVDIRSITQNIVKCNAAWQAKY